MKIIQGDLLEGDWDVAMHCCNVYRAMGAGIALALKNKWPEVYDADFDCDITEDEKYGWFSTAYLKDERIVINLYGQVGVGCKKHPLHRNCRYDFIYDSVYRACAYVTADYSGYLPIKIGIPYGMGCGLAGGSWRVVSAILEDIEERFDVEFVVYKLNSH